MTNGSADHARVDVLRNHAALLDAAAAVLAVDPSASLAEVAARAGLGRATLYRHFPTRCGPRFGKRRWPEPRARLTQRT